MRKRTLVTAIATMGVLGGAAQADVLIAGALGNGAWLDDVRNKIAATGKLAGHQIDVFNLTSGTPNLAGYDAVLTFTDATPQDPTAWGNALADFVDAGGGVVQMTFSWNIGMGGRWFSGGYSPFDAGSQSQGTRLFLGTRHVPGHPVLANVNSFDGGSSSYHNTGAVAGGAILIADWTNGAPFAAEMPGFNGRIIGLNFYAPSSDARSDFWEASTDGGQLMANGLVYVIPSPGAIALLGVAGFVTRRRRRA